MQTQPDLTPLNIEPTHAEIAARARFLWEKRGRPTGQDQEIWLEAEQDLQRCPPPDLLAARRRRHENL